MTEAQQLAKDAKESRRWTGWLLLGASIASFIALALAGWTLIGRFHDTEHRRAEQTSLNTRLSKSTLANCREIESIKTAERDRENSSFKALHRNLRLLGVKETPEILRVASKNHSRQLARFAPERCPRPTKEVKQ